MLAEGPIFFSKRQFHTFMHAVEVMIPEEGRVISAYMVARRADTLLARAKPPSGRDIRSALTLLEFVLPLLIPNVLPFSRLSLKSKRRLVEKIVENRGPLRSIARMLKTTITFCYYTHPNVREAIGYVDFEKRPRFALLDTTPFRYRSPRSDAHKIR